MRLLLELAKATRVSVQIPYESFSKPDGYPLVTGGFVEALFVEALFGSVMLLRYQKSKIFLQAEQQSPT